MALENWWEKMIVKLENINLSFNERNIISDLSLNIDKEEIICIIGPSGCGKTTVLNLISGNLEPSNGSVYRNFNKVSYVFQEDRLLPWENAENNISIVNPGADRSELKKLIKLVDLEGFEKYKPDQLSGGMRQRISIARGFFYPAELLLMDEPLKSLDYSLRMNLLNSILSLIEYEKRTLIYVTHEIDEALILADRIIVLGKNPASILEEFRINKTQKQNNLQSPEMISVRNRIISLLDKYQGSLCINKR